MISGIYKITNNINRNIYIGSAVNINGRWSEHISRLKKGSHKNLHLQNAWNKYGADAFEFSIIEECDIPSLIKREQYYLDTLMPQYNICKVAGSKLGIKHSDETRAKIGLGNKGKTHTAEACAKISASRKGVKGMPRSIESRLKISGENNRNSKLSSKQVDEIKKDTRSRAEIAKDYNVSRRTIYGIQTGRRRRLG